MAVSRNVPAPSFHSRIKLQAVGRYRTGGRLRVFVDGRLTDDLNFTSAEWIVLVLLLEAAKQVATERPFAAYIDTGTLVQQMQEISKQLREASPFCAVVDVTVHRNINKLRDKLKHASARRTLFAGTLAKRQWAHLLLERDRQLGYRLNVLPNQIEIVVLP